MATYSITSNGFYDGSKDADIFNLLPDLTDVTIKPKFGEDTVNGSESADHIVLQTGDPTATGTYDFVYLNGGNDWIRIQEGQWDYKRGQGFVDAGDGNDYVDGATIAYGGVGNDSLINIEFAYCGDGDDYVFAVTEGRTKEAYGGEGNDEIHFAQITYGGTGNDTIYMPNTLQAEAYGEDGEDRIYGTGASDTIIGGDGADYLTGGGRSDYLDGSLDDDIDFLWGGSHADTFVIHAGDARTRIGDFTPLPVYTMPDGQTYGGDRILLDGYTADDLEAASVQTLSNNGNKILVTFTDGTEILISPTNNQGSYSSDWFEFG